MTRLAARGNRRNDRRGRPGAADQGIWAAGETGSMQKYRKEAAVVEMAHRRGLEEQQGGRSRGVFQVVKGCRVLLYLGP